MWKPVQNHQYRRLASCWLLQAVFGLRKLLEMSPVLAGFSHIRNQRAWRRERRAGHQSFWAASNSGANGFESLGSVIKNWLKISWSILLSLQKIFSSQICGQCVLKKKKLIYFLRPSQNKPIKSRKFGIMMFWETSSSSEEWDEAKGYSWRISILNYDCQLYGHSSGRAETSKRSS